LASQEHLQCGQPMTIQVLAVEAYECAYEAVILIGVLHYHTPSRGNGGAT